MKPQKTSNTAEAYQWYATAHIENEEDPYDTGHTEERPCSPIYMKKETAEQNKPEKKDIHVGSAMGGCYVIKIHLKTLVINL